MREVRMTFGEHLDELRTRIIYSLFYLVGAVIVCFIFGDELMSLALRPHKRAMENARRDQMIARMVDRVQVFEGFMPGPPDAEVPIPPEDVRWEVLFASEIASSGLVADIEAPFTAEAERILADESEAFTPEQKQDLAARLRRVGRGLAERSVARFAPARVLGRSTDYLEEFRGIDAQLAELEEKFGSGRTERLIGLGHGIGEVRDPLQRFIKYLGERREEAERSSASLPLLDLESRVANSELPQFFSGVIADLQEDIRQISEPDTKLMVINYLENFMNYMKVALVFGLALAFPFILYEMWKFVGAGLYEHEQKYVILFTPFSLLLFASGVLFGYFAMIPIGLRFLASWGSTDVNLSITLNNYVGLFLTLTLILGLVFQIPLIMIFLSKIDIVTVDGFRRLRRPAIFVLFVSAAIITPPDPITMILMAGPLVALYEIGIIMSWLINRKRDRERKAEA